MRISEENISKLADYGFEAVDKENEEYCVCNADFKYCIGHSRRGQFYYILVEDGSVNLYASEPDGSGGMVALPDILIRLVQDGIVVAD